MPQTYCGNKANFTGLINGTHIIGTNYQCLRKGIGVGLHLPYDNNYTLPYVPIDNRKYYCGKQQEIPIAGNYFALGSPSKCLSIGIGVGKSQTSLNGVPRSFYFIRYFLPYILFIFINSIIFIIFYISKPVFLSKKDNENKNIIDWSKFIPYYLLSCLTIFILIFYFWKKYIY